MKTCYDIYKKSHNKWIGAIPSHWEVMRMKFKHNFYTGDSIKDEHKAYYCDNNNARPYVATKDITVNSHSIDYDNGMWVKLHDPRFEVAPANSILLCIEGGSAGRKIGFTDREVSFINKLCCITPLENSQQCSAYLYYYMLSKNFKENFQLYISGLIGGVSVGTLRTFSFPMPPYKEQVAIAAWLDSKCAEIEALLEKQRVRLNLLDELKQTVISHAVTKGLNPDAELCHSGVEWIGEIPSHWSCAPFKRFVRINNGSDYKNIEVDEGYPVMGSGGCFAHASDYMYDGEAVLMGRKGTVDKPLYMAGKFWCVDTMFYVIPKQSNSARFLYYVATTFPFERYRTATAIPSMTQTDLGCNTIAVPPIDEQVEIADYLDRETAKIDTQVARINREIELLQEYKLAVITEVVTGKRRVCDVVTPSKPYPTDEYNYMLAAEEVTQ